MAKKLRPEQTQAIQTIFDKFKSKRSLVFQLPTGGGKTFTFCSLANIIHEQKPIIKILFLVHRKKLLLQAASEMYSVYNKKMSVIDASTQLVPSNNFYIAMAKTLYRRLTRNPSYLEHMDLVVIDEAHRGEFKKLLPLFPSSKILGVTATPISSDIRSPLNSFYEDIIEGQQISELISLGSLTPNITITDYSSADTSTFASKKTKSGDYSERFMGNEFSKHKNITNTVDVYKKLCLGEKTIIFNCSIDHSDKVNKAFLEAGFFAKVIHGKMKENDIEDTISWFENTPNAILNSVDLVTTGLDVPSIKNVILNRSTTSLALYLQMCGRGSRRYEDKEQFKIIDLGGNYYQHGDWSDNRNWRYLFENPDQPRDDKGVPPMKDCPECMAMLYASAMRCFNCGYVFPDKTIYDGKPISLEVKRNNTPFQISLDQIKQTVAANNYNRFYGLHKIKTKLLTDYSKNTLEIELMTPEAYYMLLEDFKKSAAEYCKSQKIRMTAFVENYIFEVFDAEVKRIYNFEIPKQ